MGCDIHAFVEIKVSGIWYTYSHPLIDRDYDLFTLVAGVRDCGRGVVPISAPRGLPEDISNVVKIERDHYGTNGHSDSWLSVGEIKEIVKHKTELDKKDGWRFEHEELGYLCGNGIGDFTPNSRSYAPEIEDVRLVFWFDN